MSICIGNDLEDRLECILSFDAMYLESEDVFIFTLQKEH